MSRRAAEGAAPKPWRITVKRKTSIEAKVRNDPTIASRGVEFIQEPADRPYGVEAIFRDDSGNWFSLTERREWDSGKPMA